MTAKALPGSGRSGTRERILEVALRLFARNGYAGASLDEVANEVGIRRPSLFHHFKDKPTLFRAVWDKAIGEQTGHTEARFAGGSGSTLERLDVAVDAWLDYAVENPDFVYLVIHVMASGRNEDFPRGASTGTLELWQALLDDGRRDGVFRPIPLSECMALVGGWTSFYLITPNNRLPLLVDSYDPDISHFRTHLKQAVRDLLLV